MTERTPAATPAATPHPAHPAHPAVVGAGWLILGILLIAANLRAPVTGVGPLIESLQQAFGFSAGIAGLLLTLPLACFALLSPVSAWVARSVGLERTLFLAMLLVALGIALRSTGSAAALLIGTCIIGGGIAGGNVLLPSLLKRDFPHDLTRLTAIYGLTMNTASALGSVCAVPLAERLGWSWALASFIVLPLVAMLAWLPQLARHTPPAATPAKSGSVWSSALAWQVTLFLGTNSFVYYVVTAWLPSMLVANGQGPVEAGNLHGLLQFSSAVAGLLLVPLVRRMQDQRLIAGGTAAMCVVGALGLIVWPSLAIVWVPVFGFGSGAVFILGLAFVGMRVSTPQQAASLSAMAQCVGYLMAAAGPMLMGRLHDALGDWNLVLAATAAISVVMGFFGMLAGRAGRVIGAPHPH
ncbi:MFS transporter [Herbaspirillum sp. LeCh32-8]|uniref:MFS transporter n=1 Tax=Herbaspirillum sp. LeCh32-8 TaxID=2821356 RepID=UPI001AE8DC25|nr:MFS transporter [Herbaspirillum sp. LeCh32-8]MBP0600777.1 MFS transporter [Herbaspirillum sp. LeCh32-8]